jgi:hypothetical protein
MEEIEIRDALRRHVTAGEPPLGLTAAALLSRGRQRLRWRIGLGLGSGGAAVVLVAGTLSLTPLAGGPAFDRDSCTLPLAQGYRPAPSARVPEYPNSPTNGPTSSMDPVFGGPSLAPTDYPTVEPTDGPGPSFHPTYEPPSPTYGPPSSELALPSPTNGPPEGPLPSPTDVATPEKVKAAQCYLARRLQELVPGARFAPDAAPLPFELYGGVEERGHGHYAANGIIVKGNAASQLHIVIDGAQNEEGDGPPPSAENDTWQRSTISGRLTRTLRDGGMLQVKVYAEHSTLSAFMTGALISPRDLAGLLLVPELDIA